MRSSTTNLAMLLSASLLAVSGCSKPAEDVAAESETAAAATDAAAVSATRSAGSIRVDNEAPGLDTSAAPGVAFTYRYAFTLPAKAISRVQREHIAACERLGIKLCQITGTAYEQPSEGEVQARLDFLLVPSMAQDFGNDAAALVERAEGRLANASVNGENAGGAIKTSQNQSASVQSELSRIEQRLIIPGLSKEERRELARQASALRGQLRGERDFRQQKEASIAKTPVTFDYTSEGIFTETGNPFGKAAKASMGSFASMFSVLLTLLGLALPWLMLAGLIAMLIRMRAMKQKLSRLTAESPSSAVAAEPAA
jgi:hypothetical protein